VRRVVKISAVGCLVVLLVLAGALWSLYRASQQVPDFYREALSVDSAAQRKASNQMVRQASTLANDVRKEGQWEAVFTAQQINGWLAVDLVENHPRALPPAIRHPRVAIHSDEIAIACRVQQGKLNSVVTLTVEPYLQEPNVLALRIRKARAGLLPIPLAELLDRASKAAADMKLDLRWQQADGDPVAVIRVPPPRDENNKLIRVEALRLGDGEIYVSGTTERK